MSLSTQPYKGTRDFYPEDKRLQKYMFDVIRKVVESFGYQEYDAPIVEPFELYAAKSGEEIVNEQLYSFEDRGGRKVAIRPEMTPSVSRLVAGRRQELAYPLRLYSIPNLWRYERPQRGRLREHWQLNVDIFGEGGLAGDAEIIQVADAILKAFGAKSDMYEIRINSRQFLHQYLLDELQIPESKVQSVIKLLDKKAKLPKISFSDEFQRILHNETDNQLLKLWADLDNLSERLIQEPKIQKLISLLQKSNISVYPDALLARGFDYYTDIVFEVFDKNPDNNRSMFGGGRYDGLVGMFGVEPIPTVGFGMGDVTLLNFLQAHKLAPELRPETDVTVILIGQVYDKAQPVLAKLRGMGLNLAVDATDRKLDTKLRHAEKSGVDGVFFIGEQELATGSIRAKHLKRGKEQTFSLEEIEDAAKRWFSEI